MKMVFSAVFIFLAIPVFCQMQFVAPVPVSSNHNPKRCIIIREGHPYNEDVLQKKKLFSIEGSKSGKHDFSMELSKDDRTLILKPLIPYAYGEEVIVSINKGVQLKNGIQLTPFSFSFFIQRQYTSAEQQELQQIIKRINFGNLTDTNRPFDSTVDKHLIVLLDKNPAAGQVFYDYALGSTPRNTGCCITKSNGDSVFCQEDSSGTIVDFKINHNGYLTHLDHDGSEHDMLDSSYNLIQSFKPLNGYETDAHEFQIYPDGHYYIIGLDAEVVDMRKYDSSYRSDAIVAGSVIQEIDSSGHLVFEWRSFDHVDIPEALHEDLSAGYIDCIHTNSIDEDTDGNIIVSFRNLDQVAKIDTHTGNFIWRLGGIKNEFTFVNDSQPFNYQHDARRLGNGHITLYDNADWDVPQISSAREYSLDLLSKTATLVWSYQHPLINGIPVYGSILGSVQRLPNKGTLINWGQIKNDPAFPSITEIDSTNQIVWEGRVVVGSNTSPVYRAYRFDWRPCARPTDVDLKATDISTSSARLSWSSATNAASYEIQYRDSGTILWDSIRVEDTANSVELLNLKPHTSYEWRMQTLCDSPNALISNYTAIKRFTTLFPSSFEDIKTGKVDLVPNPARDAFTIHFPFKINGSYELLLVNETGVNVLEQKILSNDQAREISVKNFPDGIYEVKIIIDQTILLAKLAIVH